MTAERPTHAPVSDPTHATHFDIVQAALALNEEELSLLRRNGFVVTDRLAFEQFKRAYAYLYWKDLPVLVTTDSILHVLHQTYDQMVRQIESTLLTTWLVQLLSTSRAYLRQAARDNTDPRLAPLYADLETYLTVPLVLLNGTSTRSIGPAASKVLRQMEPVIIALQRRLPQTDIPKRRAKQDKPVDDDIRVLEGIRTLEIGTAGIETVNLFGLERDVDFSQFQARGHYDKPEELVVYFAAMMWLAVIDFRLVITHRPEHRV